MSFETIDIHAGRRRSLRNHQSMKAVATDYFGEAEDKIGGGTVAMEVDSSSDIFGKGHVKDLQRIADTKFFNSFQDDFDDGDIN